MQIYPAIGVDRVLFGMNEQELVALLGPPDKVVTSDNGNRDLCYYALKLILKIEPNNESRLGWISVRNRSSRLTGIDPWSMKREQLLSHLSLKFSEAYEVDDYGEMESYTFGEIWVELQFELDELTSINFGVPYDPNDMPIWPSKSA
ncbi:hypothetical protein AACH06_29790 [Ideonella sp. DXS29W]|uniref:Uncharacterized protein n=1 Tax=Ideonella lacteola TaxID=2984193 RepID=A0ABU9BZ25_9BURK